MIWHAHSPACYRSILSSDTLVLPSTNSLQRLNHNFNINYVSIVTYLKARRSKLNDFESTVTLIFDEVYVYQRPDYANGKFIG